MSEALCRLDEIDDPGARGFTRPQDPREIFVVRRGGDVHGYVNSCPHIGTPLEFRPDQFLTRERDEILCSTHGARFEIATGRCTAGPCHGRSLQAVAVGIVNGWVILNPSG